MLELGTIVGGKYCLEEAIAEGGMATIWRAVHMDLDRPVAVKFLSAHKSASKNAKERFLREARVAASVRHRYVVDTIDFGLTDDGQAYIVMELLDGESLAERLTEGPPLHVSQLLAIANSALKGLAAVHAAGIVHRDLKPENIVLVRDSDRSFYPKLIDFGISRAISESSVLLGPGRVTREGMVVGTPHYMSPEQARGLADIDLRTDIYSMGVILYEGLTGELPFDDVNPGDLLVKIMSEVAAPVSTFRADLGQPLSDVIERSMARDRNARHPTADAMREALLTAAQKTAETATGWGQALIGVGPLERTRELGTPSIRSVDPLDRATVSQSPAAPATQPEPRPAQAEGAPVGLAPPAASRRGSWIALALALALAVVAALGAVLSRKGDGAEESRAHEAPDPAPPPAEAPARETVRVSLSGVPAGAIVSVDGNETAGPEITLEREDRSHAIAVRAEGFAPWRVDHRATADGSYMVELVEQAPPEPPPAPRPAPVRRAVRDSTDRHRPTPGGALAEPTTSAFRDPGF